MQWLLNFSVLRWWSPSKCTIFIQHHSDIFAVMWHSGMSFQHCRFPGFCPYNVRNVCKRMALRLSKTCLIFVNNVNWDMMPYQFLHNAMHDRGSNYCWVFLNKIYGVACRKTKQTWAKMAISCQLIIPLEGNFWSETNVRLLLMKFS